MDREKEKRQYPSPGQKLRLAQLLEADVELRNGKFTSSFTKQAASTRWDKIAEEVNSITGAKKTGKEWRSTWADMKSYVKKKNAGQRRSLIRTGGGPPDDPMPSTSTRTDDIILATISDTALAGHSDSQESRAQLIDFTEIEDYVQINDDAPATSALPSTSPKISDVAATTISLPSTSRAPQQFSSSFITHPSTLLTGNQRGRAKKRTVAQRQLQTSLDTAQAMHEELKEKNKIKKEFNEAYLIVLQRQTDAILDLVSSVRSVRNIMLSSHCP